MTFEKCNYKENDKVYLGRQEYGNPKEYFKKIRGLVEAQFGQNPVSLIDIGCAAGAFLYYMKNNLNLSKGVGVDISGQHLAQAKEVMPDIEFVQDSILELQNILQRKFDVCTSLGCLSVFDNIEVVLRNLLRLVRKGGFLYIYDIVNDEPVDMLMRYRNVSNNGFSEWQSGLNVRSVVTYRVLIEEIDSTLKLDCHDFEMPLSIPKSSDPMRSWTIQTEHKKHQIVVGTGQMLNFKILEIYKPK